MNFKETCDLWYEIHYLRLILNQIIENHPELKLNADLDIEKCKRNAQEIVRNRYAPFLKSLESPNPENAQECPSCNDSAQIESPDASQDP